MNDDREAPALTLGKLLRDADKISCDNFLYLPANEVWDLQSRCAILSVSDADGLPPEAIENQLAFALQIAAIQDVVANTVEQLGQPSDMQLLEALLFYFDHDAFLEFGENA
jgi:hypothetical protein